MARALVVLAIVVVIVLVVTGVIYVTRTDDTVNITIDKSKLRDVKEKAAEEGREATRRIGQGLERAGEELQQAPDKNRDPGQPVESNP